jgi:phospholipid/cholesterol/gamma-HCH transport system substrate-binding protein
MNKMPLRQTEGKHRMENKSHALAAGVFVVVVAAMLVGLAMWLLRDSTNTITYEMFSDAAVTGLQPQASVQFKGVAIGKVTDISFDPEHRGRVRVRIAVSPNAPITQSTYATLTFQGVTGLTFVQLDDPGGSSEPPAPGPNGSLPRIPLRGNAIGQLTDRAGELMDKVEQATDSINQMLGGNNQAALATALKEIGDAAKSLDHLAANTDKTIQTQLGPGGADVPALVRQATGTLKSLQGASDQAHETLDQLNAAAADLHHGMDALNDSVTTVNTTTLPRIQGLADDTGRTLRRFDHVLDTFDENPQLLIYGSGAPAPGPGEPGFTAPAAAPTTAAPAASAAIPAR